MSLAVVKKKLDKLNLQVCGGWGKGDIFSLFQKEDPKKTEKRYQSFKETSMKLWAEREKNTIEYYAKLGITRTPRPIPNDKYYRQEFEDIGYSREEYDISLSDGQSSFSCAINEFGNFSLNRNQVNDYWEWLFRYYIATTKFHYLKCATPVKKAYEKIRAGLKAAGFEMRASEKSNHGKYQVEVWEFIKDKKKEKK